MNVKFIKETLVVKIPGSKLPKVLDLAKLDDRTRKEIMKAYHSSEVFAPNLTATKAEKLSAAMSSNLDVFYEFVKSGGQEVTPQVISSAFCGAFEFDSIKTPNIVNLIQSIATGKYDFINIDTMIDILREEHNRPFVTAAEIYSEFQGWVHYPMIKECVGGVSVVKFLRFFMGVMKTI